MHDRQFEEPELPNEENVEIVEGDNVGCLPFIEFLIIVIFLL